MLVDSHCHLDRLKLEPYENGLDGAVQAATERGVSAMLCVCISEDNLNNVIDIACRYEQIFASVGVHPCDVNSEVVSVDTLCSWAERDKVIAFGESGLDYFHSKDHIDTQQESFIHHLLAGKKTGLPVIVHTRDAREDTIALIQQYTDPDVAGVMHCFTESWEMAKQAMDNNFYISLSGIVTFKNAVELQEVAKKIPLDKLLIETDSPYLAPVPYRGKPNEPKYVRDVAEFIAQLRGVSFEELAEATTRNFYRLFSKANPEKY